MLPKLRKEICSVVLVRGDEILIVCRWWQEKPFLGLPTRELGNLESIAQFFWFLAGLYLVNPPRKLTVLQSHFIHPQTKEDLLWDGHPANLHIVMAFVNDAKETPKHNGEWRKIDDIKPWPDVTVDCLLASQDFQKVFSQTRVLVAA